MELKRYLRVLARHWWLAGIALNVTVLATLALVSAMPPVYESTGTLVLRPRLPGTESDAIDASDLLIRGVKIAETYATVAKSDLIRERAVAQLDPEIDPSGVKISAEVLTDTNVLSITASGSDAQAVQALSAAVMTATDDYVDSLEDAYLMVPLDAPTLPGSPVGPNRVLTIGIGGVLGLMLAVVLAMFAEYLRGDPRRDDPLKDASTRLHNARYLRERLHEEIKVSDRTRRTFALAVMRVAIGQAGDGGPRRVPAPRFLRRIGELLRLAVADEVAVGYLGNGEFAAILPETESAEADELLVRWESSAIAVLEGQKPASSFPKVVAVCCRYAQGSFIGGHEAMLVFQRLLDEEDPTPPSRKRSLRRFPARRSRKLRRPETDGSPPPSRWTTRPPPIARSRPKSSGPW